MEKKEEVMKKGMTKYRCNDCGNVQKEGEHEKKQEDMARDMGIGSMIGAPSLACIKCGSQKLRRVED